MWFIKWYSIFKPLFQFRKDVVNTEITKKYDMETFEANETSIGYPIDVYQDSINKTFTEYLVHFDYFKDYIDLNDLSYTSV